MNGATLDQNDQDECGPADISTVGIRAKDQFPVATVSENNTKRLHTLKRPEIIHNGNQRCPSDGRDRMVDGPRNVVMEDSFLPHIMHHRETQGQESHAKRDAFLLSSGAALDPHSAPGIASAAAVFTRPSTASAVEGLQFQYQRQYQNGRQNRDRGIATAIATAGVTSGDGEARQSNGIRMRPKSGIGCRVQRHEHDIFAPLNGHFS